MTSFPLPDAVCCTATFAPSFSLNSLSSLRMFASTRGALSSAGFGCVVGRLARGSVLPAPRRLLLPDRRAHFGLLALRRESEQRARVAHLELAVLDERLHFVGELEQ